MIDVQNLTKQFDGTTVLDGVSATFRDGEVNMIIGQSGSGKTVLMKSMIGLHKPESGRILYGEGASARNICAMSESELRLLHREVGMLFQGSALFDSQTVVENVMFPLEMFSDMNPDQIVERAHFCLERVNIPERAYRLMPGEISGGMQKRVAIARAIALNPKYLFCDEPNSGLDPRTSLVIDQLISDVTREFGICTIVNSHDMNSILEIGDNILFLRNGKKEWQGSRHEIFHADNEALNDFVFASDLFKKVRAANR
ncbi:MAG: ATP-binding cassette domain-containing protein [Paludibacteraceae bacterium]|nr:ATP-binding cassette domain-containing protein [Paludibacteraceae bacterium]